MENWKNKVTLACKRYNLDVNFCGLKYGYERAKIPCDSFHEMEAIEAKFSRLKGLCVEHWYVSSACAFTGYVYIIGEDDYNSLAAKEAAEKAYLNDWWTRYHYADAETRRLMACGAIA